MSSTAAVHRTHARPLLAVIGVLILLAALGALPGSPPAIRAADHGVQIQGFAFDPSTLSIAVGDTVTWTNADSAPHTVTAQDGSFDSGNLDQGQTFSFTFTTTGTYEYRCDYHRGMTASVVVEAAAPVQPTPAPAPPSAGNPAPAPTASPAAAAGGQPNTALPAPATGLPPIAPLLIGLGLLALAAVLAGWNRLTR